MFLRVALNFRLKGVSEAIHAFSRWVHQKPSRRGSRLVVVGRDTAEGYQRQASMRDVGGQVVFVARTDEVFPWYSAADVCVLLSWYDPCSRTVLEATRWGVPSITTSCNGAGEVLAAGAGIVVGEPSDIAATAAAMEDMSDPARRAQRARKCLELTDSLGLERHVRGLLEVYAQVVARPAGGGR
jgi:UDP-glucose:(heptosyl)LPS alpha-1,3-glucosyltransferase